MATFSSLPAELKICIADAMSPMDCFRFAMASKQLWALCDSTISSHRKLSEKYRLLRTQPQQQTLWRTLKEVLQDPRIAEYVREVQIDESRGTYYDDDVWNTGDEQAGTVKLSAEDLESFVKAFKDNPFLNDPMESMIDNYSSPGDPSFVIESGHDAPIIPALLFLLPNLRALRFIPQSYDHWLMNGIQQVAWWRKAGYTHAMMPFEHLTRVDIAHDDWELCADVEWVDLFFGMPSLKFFAGHMIGTYNSRPGDGYCFQQMPEMPSSVETLRLTRSCISGPDMCRILSRATKLKKFVYENGGATISSAYYHPRKMVAELGRRCSETLEHLELFDDTGHNREHELDLEKYTAGPVHHFKKLKVLRCFLGDLVPGLLESNNMDYYEAITHALESQTLFPESVEVLHFEELSRLGEAQKLEILNKILSAKEAGILPNLRQLYMFLVQGNSCVSFSQKAEKMGVHYHYYSSLEEDVDDLFTGCY